MVGVSKARVHRFKVRGQSFKGDQRGILFAQRETFGHTLKQTLYDAVHVGKWDQWTKSRHGCNGHCDIPTWEKPYPNVSL